MNYTKRNLFVGTSIFILVFTVFANLTTDALINGDAAVYAQQINAYDFSRRTIHIGYYLIGAIFSTLFPFWGDYTLNLMNCFFGALTVSLVYFMGFTISGKHTVGIVSGLFLATNFLFVVNALYAEVYIVQVFFIILALQLWILDRSIVAALAMSLAFLVTPSSLFALVIFPILRPQAKKLFLFVLVYGIH